ncbi:hypothetical protein BE17_04005 [Sorangium cellulosum]|uniref:Uncharacterized protein n=1 Tax=Sorangium cellulosum TaxID=56 RepID=A0A150SQK0_SORCE|nr:hypothetical protein BE17_04005 [Sorangium cellulosum]
MDAIHRLSMVGQLSPDEAGKLDAAQSVGLDIVSDTIEERRRKPLDNDVMTLLIQAEEQGDRPSKDELVALVAAVLLAGRRQPSTSSASRCTSSRGCDLRFAPLDPEDDVIARPPARL